MMYWLGRCSLLAVCVQVTFGQTLLDLRTQSKSIDFSGANATKPFQAGAILPATCSIGQMFFQTNAPAGRNLYGCTSTNAWTQESGGNAGMAGQLGDFLVTRTNSSLLAIGSNCSGTTPCNVRFGSLTYSLVTGATVSISGGTGVAFIYVSSSGALMVGHNLAASCSVGCTAQSGVSAFPSDAIPLFTWTATNGSWDTAGGADQRAVLSTQVLHPGAGMLIVQSSGQTTIAPDPTVVGLRVATPAISTSPCAAGSWAADNSFYYVCISANTWKRAPVASW